MAKLTALSERQSSDVAEHMLLLIAELKRRVRHLLVRVERREITPAGAEPELRRLERDLAQTNIEIEGWLLQQQGRN